MATQDEWHERFKAINNREPNAAEFQAALRNGEFQLAQAASPQPPQGTAPQGDPQTGADQLQSYTAPQQQAQSGIYYQQTPQPYAPQYQQQGGQQYQQPYMAPQQPYAAPAQQQYQQPYMAPQAQRPSTNNSGFSVTAAVNKLAGGTGTVQIHLKNLFSDVFKKHSRKESERIFIGGTAYTTPSEDKIASTWPKPWLFSRVFLLFIVTYVILYFLQSANEIVPSYVGLIFIGAMAVPFSVLIFYFECNAPRNISFWSVLQMFFVGGALSLVAVMYLNRFAEGTVGDQWGFIVTGIVEELAKLVALAIFIKRLKPKYILNGLLIGGAIGAGFAVFETAGYGFDSLTQVSDGSAAQTLITYINNGIQKYGDIDGITAALSQFFQEYGFPSMNSTLILRGLSAIGGHVAWAAISGAALVMATRGEDLQAHHFVDKRFLQLFWIPVVLHAIWDSPLAAGNDNNGYIQKIGMAVLSVLAWIVILVTINAGLQQINQLHTGTTTPSATGTPNLSAQPAQPMQQAQQTPPTQSTQQNQSA